MWRVGVLFSRSGATAVSETEHFFGTALAIEELNNAGGILGRPIEPVVYDPTSDPLSYRRYAERLLGDDGVNVIFGCSTSSCRLEWSGLKSAMPSTPSTTASPSMTNCARPAEPEL